MAIEPDRAPALATRAIDAKLREALSNSPIVLLQGPRHSFTLGQESEPGLGFLEGASALNDAAKRGIAQVGGGGGAHLTHSLNLFANRIAAERDPASLLGDGQQTVVILEAQRGPGLFVALAEAVKKNPRPGRFLLVSHADLASAAHIAQVPGFAGLPLQIVRLDPPTQAELQGSNANWLDAVFGGKLDAIKLNKPVVDAAMVELLLNGSQLECIARDRPRSRHAWQTTHLAKLLDSPPKRRIGSKEEKLLLKYPPLPPSDLSDIRNLLPLDKAAKALPLMTAIAYGTGAISNYRQWGMTLDMDSKTTERYTQALEHLFLVEHLDAIGMGSAAKFPLVDNSRMVRAPKFHVTESGLLGDLLDENGVNMQRLRVTRNSVWTAGTNQMLESFMVNELRRLGTSAAGSYSFGHYRDHDQQSVSLAVANSKNEVIGVEVKGAGGLNPSDAKAMGELSTKFGKHMKLGVILYDGKVTQKVSTLPSGAPLWIAPLSSLWGSL